MEQETEPTVVYGLGLYGGLGFRCLLDVRFRDRSIS